MQIASENIGSSLIPKNKFCHFTIDLKDRPAKIDIIRYKEKEQGLDELIDIQINSSNRGFVKQNYFSDENIRNASVIQPKQIDGQSTLYLSE